jgi:pimeloyl-ACP methyl ester carboxylesterase
MEVTEVRLGDVRLAVAEAGAGGRPLMLVHGFTGAKEDFTEFLDRLAGRGWHAVAPDLRGHGASDHPADPAGYSLETFASDVRALADARGWQRFVLLGHSMGGMIAQHVALDDPWRLRGLVLMDTTHGPVDWVDPDAVALGTAVVRDEGMYGLMLAQNSNREDDTLVTPAFPNAPGTPSSATASSWRARRPCGWRWRRRCSASPTGCSACVRSTCPRSSSRASRTRRSRSTANEWPRPFRGRVS